MFQYRDSGRFAVHEYVVMPNHVHVLFSIEEGNSLGQAMQLMKGGFSHALGVAGLGMKAVWQPGYYDHRVRDTGEYVRIRNYIRTQPGSAGVGGDTGRVSVFVGECGGAAGRSTRRAKAPNEEGLRNAGLKAGTTRNCEADGGGSRRRRSTRVTSGVQVVTGVTVWRDPRTS